MLEPITLAGRHVRLEPLALGHAAAMAAAAGGPRDSYIYTGVPTDVASAVSYIEAALESQATGRALPFATIDVASGKLVGSTRFFDIQFWPWPEGNPHQRGVELPDATEIGHTWLNPAAQRSGINTEAKLLMLGHAFEVWCVHRVRLSTDARNERSRRAIERLGMRFDGILRANSAGYDGTVRDSAFYSMLDSDWPAAKRALLARLR